MPRIPDSWTLSNQIANNNAIITVPASPGIMHVIDDVTWSAINNTAAALNGTVTIVDNDSGATLLTWNLQVPINAQTEEVSVGPWQSGVGSAMILRFNFNANFTQILAHGHDL